MKKSIQRIMLLVVAVICCLACFVGCGSTTKVKQEVYVGSVELSPTMELSLKLIIDEAGTFTMSDTNNSYISMGGVCTKSKDEIVFKRLDGKQIATAKTTDAGMTISYYGMDIQMTGGKEKVKGSSLMGAYKGYVDDGDPDDPFELRLIVRPDNQWCVIEEDGDLNHMGYYEQEDKLITFYEDKYEVYASGAIDGKTISVNLNGDHIVFEKVKS